MVPTKLTNCHSLHQEFQNKISSDYILVTVINVRFISIYFLVTTYWILLYSE